VYWVLISVGALRASCKLLISPFFWEKTAHGSTPHVVERGLTVSDCAATRFVAIPRRLIGCTGRRMR